MKLTNCMVIEEKRKHKLILITPSGKEYKIGFLSPCTDGFVLGTAKAEDVETSHLTVLVKNETLSSHITSQDGLKQRQYFPSLEIKEIGKKLKTLVEDNLIVPLPPDELYTRLISGCTPLVPGGSFIA